MLGYTRMMDEADHAANFDASSSAGVGDRCRRQLVRVSPAGMRSDQC